MNGCHAEAVWHDGVLSFLPDLLLWPGEVLRPRWTAGRVAQDFQAEQGRAPVRMEGPLSGDPVSAAST